jgi:hypothetical protein
MLPDNIHHQAPEQTSLPPVQAQAIPQAMPVPALSQAPAAPTLDSTQAIERAKTLANQYAANPYAFNAAFQQLKSQYLLEHYHIDPNQERK